MNLKRGEVIRVNLDPTEGREQAGNARPCLIISNTQYNEKRKGMVIAMPITSTQRPEIKTMIPIPDEAKVYGSVIAEQVRTVDLNTRWWRTTEEILAQQWVDSVVETLNAIIQ
ncbi:MAG: type II toxin-antitoxin system PemK/MazF family toxin [Cyanobacteria bacterium P01_A01_bin.116]